MNLDASRANGCWKDFLAEVFVGVLFSTSNNRSRLKMYRPMLASNRGRAIRYRAHRSIRALFAPCRFRGRFAASPESLPRDRFHRNASRPSSGPFAIDGNGGNGHVRFVVQVSLEHGHVVHAIQLVTRQNQNILQVLLIQVSQVFCARHRRCPDTNQFRLPSSAEPPVVPRSHR